MTGAGQDLYALMLAVSSKLKLRAKGLLADGEGDAPFRAAVLLHEAARMQRRATEALPECPPATRLASAVEECWCFVEGFDPPRAAEAWGAVLRMRSAVDAKTAAGLLARLEPRFEKQRAAFARAIGTTLAMVADARSFTALNASKRAAARREVASVLEQFPGAMNFWWMAYRLVARRGGGWLRRARSAASTLRGRRGSPP